MRSQGRIRSRRAECTVAFSRTGEITDDDSFWSNFEVSIAPNNYLAIKVRDYEIIPNSTDSTDWPTTMQDTLQCSSMGIPDSDSLIP